MSLESVPYYVSGIAVFLLHYINYLAHLNHESIRLQRITRILFGSYRRTVGIHSVSLLGFVIQPFLGSIPYFSLEFNIVLQYVLWYAIFVGIVVLPSIAFAECRKKKPPRATLMSLFEDPDEPCFQELIAHLSANSSSELDIHDLLSILEGEHLLEWLSEGIVKLNLSEECIDELFWNSFFDRFEESPYSKPRINRFTQKAFDLYTLNRSNLMMRDSDISQVFMDSLKRWKGNMHLIS